MTTMEDVLLQRLPERPKKKRKKPRIGKPNKLTWPVLPPNGCEWGPAMKALRSDKHRAFVLAAFQVKQGNGWRVRAVKAAGFGTSTSSANSWHVIAHLVAHDETVLAALHEEGKRRLGGIAPRAVVAAERLVENPLHRDHARAVGMVMDRVYPAETHHTVDVNHTDSCVHHSPEQLAAMLQRFALTFGLDQTKVLAAPVIDSDFQVIKP